MTEAQIRRYARHILLPDVGGIGQTALLEATAQLAHDDAASRIAAAYLAAGGAGTLVVPETLRDELAGCNPDTRVTSSGAGRAVTIPGRPAWWPAAADDEVALAFWCGSIAAARWMLDVVSR